MNVSASGGVSLGVAAATEADAELRDCYEGGSRFVDRIALLSARKRAAETAEKNLQLGKEAKAALADASEKQAAAAADRRDAAGARAIAAKVKEEADAYAAKLRADAEETLQRAEERNAAIERRGRELAAEHAALKAAQKKLAEAQRAAEKRRRNVDVHLQAMCGVLAEIEEI
jgi:hypothetical protein